MRRARKKQILFTFMKLMKLKLRYSYHATLKLNAEPQCFSHDRAIIIKLTHELLENSTGSSGIELECRTGLPSLEEGKQRLWSVQSFWLSAWKHLADHTRGKENPSRVYLSCLQRLQVREAEGTRICRHNYYRI